ncbi:ABC transporter ATP-binding protein [Phormidesmis sp. 146-12]
MAAEALQVKNLSKRFGEKQAVNSLNLSIRRGECYALLGRNGAGKTTTLRMLAGLLQADDGDTFILGESVKQSPAKAKKNLAYVPDEPLLYGKLTPLEYLEFVAGLWGIPAKKVAETANQLLENVGFSGDANQFCEVLNKGERQKVSIAGAFIHEPKVVILDEPLSGLDVVSVKKVKDKLKQYVDSGNTVIITTHIMEIAEKMAERIGIIHDGQLIAEGTFDDLKSQSNQAGGTLESVLLELTKNQTANENSTN